MSNKKWLISITLILSVMSNNALAQDSESLQYRILKALSSLDQDSDSALYCDEEKVDTVSLKQCAMQELNVEKDRLDRVYKKLMSILDSSNKQRLKTSQLAWIDFSRKDCSFQTDWETGTMGPLMSIACETGFTQDRSKDLEDHLEYELNSR